MLCQLKSINPLHQYRETEGKRVFVSEIIYHFVLNDADAEMLSYDQILIFSIPTLLIAASQTQTTFVTASSSVLLSISTMSDEEPVDPKKELETVCKAKCVREWRAYEDCVLRIKDDDTGTKHCTGQSFDYWHCVDKCVAPKLFAKLNTGFGWYTFFPRRKFCELKLNLLTTDVNSSNKGWKQQFFLVRTDSLGLPLEWNYSKVSESAGDVKEPTSKSSLLPDVNKLLGHSISLAEINEEALDGVRAEHCGSSSGGSSSPNSDNMNLSQFIALKNATATAPRITGEKSPVHCPPSKMQGSRQHGLKTKKHGAASDLQNLNKKRRVSTPHQDVGTNVNKFMICADPPSMFCEGMESFTSLSMEELGRRGFTSFSECLLFVNEVYNCASCSEELQKQLIEVRALAEQSQQQLKDSEDKMKFLCDRSAADLVAKEKQLKEIQAVGEHSQRKLKDSEDKMKLLCDRSAADLRAKEKQLKEIQAVAEHSQRELKDSEDKMKLLCDHSAAHLRAKEELISVLEEENLRLKGERGQFLRLFIRNVFQSKGFLEFVAGLMVPAKAWGRHVALSDLSEIQEVPFELLHSMDPLAEEKFNQTFLTAIQSELMRLPVVEAVAAREEPMTLNDLKSLMVDHIFGADREPDRSAPKKRNLSFGHFPPTSKFTSSLFPDFPPKVTMSSPPPTSPVTIDPSDKPPPADMTSAEKFCSRVSKADALRIAKRFKIPEEFGIIAPDRNCRACNPPDGYAAVYEQQFRFGLRFPLFPLVSGILSHYEIPLAQLAPKAMLILAGFSILCSRRGAKPSVDLFRCFYELRRVPAVPNTSPAAVPNTSDDWYTAYPKRQFGEFKIKPLVSDRIIPTRGWRERFYLVRIEALGLSLVWNYSQISEPAWDAKEMASDPSILSDAKKLLGQSISSNEITDEALDLVIAEIWGSSSGGSSPDSDNMTPSQCVALKSDTATNLAQGRSSLLSVSGRSTEEGISSAAGKTKHSTASDIENPKKKAKISTPPQNVGAKENKFPLPMSCEGPESLTTLPIEELGRRSFTSLPECLRFVNEVFIRASRAEMLEKQLKEIQTGTEQSQRELKDSALASDLIGADLGAKEDRISILEEEVRRLKVEQSQFLQREKELIEFQALAEHFQHKLKGFELLYDRSAADLRAKEVHISILEEEVHRLKGEKGLFLQREKELKEMVEQLQRELKDSVLSRDRCAADLLSKEGRISVLEEEVDRLKGERGQFLQLEKDLKETQAVAERLQCQLEGSELSRGWPYYRR
ncbi:OLC1v1002547C1 [Oldenlandia corymbosa var. corymbosa]|uniref:Complex III subunit VI n=1 Tax=Oldenlandia corymbosa var. corymbosa TaxID=529605 RepID=A0AAV1DA83_OLDCO|nr:OLC1v1002547C1 [Oldenlandia corymbosa var. corymbosa]